MKKTKFLFAWLFMLAAMPVFVACGDDDDDPEVKPNTEQTEDNGTSDDTSGNSDNTPDDSSGSGNSDNTSCPDTNHPHIIDLGLPSGTKWACCNVGASSPEQYGDYFAWGETSPKSVYTQENYAYYNSSTRNYRNIGSDIAGTSYDAATANWGSPWRMPSRSQIEELLNCTYSWTTQNGVYGGKFTSRANGNSIFLPAAGYWWRGELNNAGSGGDYWSSSLDGSYLGFAYYMSFDDGGAYRFGYGVRDDGQSVRPVRQ